MEFVVERRFLTFNFLLLLVPAILKHWVDKNVDGYVTYFNKFAQYHSFPMLVLDLLNLSGLSVYHERTKIFVKVSLLWLDFVLYSRSEVEKNSHIVFQMISYFDVTLRDLKTWKSGEEK